MSFDSPTFFSFGIHPAGTITDRESIIRKCPQEFEFQLQERLNRSKRIPTLGTAPLSSWVIARLAFLDSRMPSDGFRHNGHGGFQIDVNVSLGIGVVAAFLLDGDMAQVSAIGRGCDLKSEEFTSDKMIESFVQTLLDSPTDVAECSYTVENTEWLAEPNRMTPSPARSSINEYGWRDGNYLGGQNVRKRSTHEP